LKSQLVLPPFPFYNTGMSDANTQTGFRQDITEQPEVLHRALDSYSGERRGNLENAAHLLASASVPPVLLGMGTSQYLCIGATYSFAAQRIPVAAPEAAEWIHYLAAAQPAAPTLVVSCSGESAECVRVVNETKTVIGIVNTLDSTIGRRANPVLPMFAGETRSSATKGVTNPLAILQLMAHQIGGSFDEHLDALRRTADAMAARQTNDLGSELYDFMGRPGYTDVIARGPAYGMALVAGLLLREMIPVRGNAVPAATFRHGPMLDTGANHTLICLAGGRTAGLVRDMAAEAAGRGSRVLLISDQPVTLMEPQTKVIRLPDLGEECFPFLALQVIEQYIAATVERHGTSYHLLVTTRE
jgi:fructoselysine-6-P-deglycase FrlB-like protein